jgi:hypothetical protein
MAASENPDLGSRAHTRARRGKSGWSLLFPLFSFPAIGLSWYLLAQLFLSYQKILYPRAAFLSSGTRIGNIFMFVSPAFPSIAVGFMVGNALVWCIPRAREALKRKDEKVPGTEFRSSQRGLAKFGWYVSPVLLFSFLGANNFWSLTAKGIHYRPMVSPLTRHYDWSEVRSIETGCSVSKVVDYHFVMTLRDGTSIDLAQETPGEFWTAYAQIQQALTGVTYQFSAQGLYGRCLNSGSRRWLELLSQRPTPI